MPMTDASIDAALAALRTAQITQSSRLAAPPDQVWERISTKEGINAELLPLVRMGFPRDWTRLETKDAGAPPVRSILLLLGFLPVDVHDFGLLSVTRGRGFLERSSSLLMREWIHQRQLQPVPGGTEITDRVFYRCRLSALGLAYGPLLRFVFRHRHWVLRRYFGALPDCE
jgi:ligand-binding SRPBCC domain-containing protein